MRFSRHSNRVERNKRCNFIRSLLLILQNNRIRLLKWLKRCTPTTSSPYSATLVTKNNTTTRPAHIFYVTLYYYYFCFITGSSMGLLLGISVLTWVEAFEWLASLCHRLLTSSGGKTYNNNR